MNINNPSVIRPQKVNIAVTLIYASLVLGGIRFLLDLSAKREPMALALFSFIVFGLVSMLLASLVVLIGRRKNWARVTFLVLYLIGLLPYVVLLSESLVSNPLSSLVGFVHMILQGIASMLLLQREASVWFRNNTVAPEPMLPSDPPDVPARATARPESNPAIDSPLEIPPMLIDRSSREELTEVPVHGRSVEPAASVLMRPKSVSTARMLIYTILGITIIHFLFILFTSLIDLPGPILMISVSVFLGWIGLAAWLIEMIVRRKNWARITFLVLYLLRLLSLAGMLKRSLLTTPIADMLAVFQMAGEGYALILLFQREASKWFRNKTTVPQPTFPNDSPNTSAETATSLKQNQAVSITGFQFGRPVNFKNPAHCVVLTVCVLFTAGIIGYTCSIAFSYSAVDPKQTEELKQLDESSRKARMAVEEADATMHPVRSHKRKGH